MHEVCCGRKLLLPESETLFKTHEGRGNIRPIVCNVAGGEFSWRFVAETAVMVRSPGAIAITRTITRTKAACAVSIPAARISSAVTTTRTVAAT